MSERINGGPAFPAPDAGYEHFNQRSVYMGMTLRDYFAAAALTGVMDVCRSDYPEAGTSRAEGFAKAAYVVADAMLKERAK